MKIESLKIVICALISINFIRFLKIVYKIWKMRTRKRENRILNEKEALDSLFFRINESSSVSAFVFRHAMEGKRQRVPSFSLGRNLPVAALDIKKAEKEEYCSRS